VELSLTADDKAVGVIKSLTLDLSSPIPALPTGVSLLLSADPIPQDGVHTIEIIAPTGAPFVPGATTNNRDCRLFVDPREPPAVLGTLRYWHRLWTTLSDPDYRPGRPD
jgi:hypothetical protein